MSKDYNIPMEEFKEKGFLTEDHPLMKSRLNELVRKSKVVLLTEFVEYLDKLQGRRTVFGNVVCKEIAVEEIQTFLDEREKK